MKVYNILATIIVEDEIQDYEIENICKENIETPIREDFYISNCISYYELKEIINYPDIPPSECDPDGYCYNNWKNKSQETINKIIGIGWDIL